MKLAELLASSRLPRKIFEMIIGDLFSFSKEELFLRKNKIVLSPAQVAKFKKCEKGIVERGVPYQYTVKNSYFYGREFYVDKNVLIPRPETEILLREALKFLELRIKKYESSVRQMQIVDVGTGSGCIAISLYSELLKIAKVHRYRVHSNRSKSALGYDRSQVRIYGVDISGDALKVARKNAKLHKVKINFLKSDLLRNPKLPQKFDLILANLPYLPSSDITPESPIYHEPRVALDGGRDGLDLIKKLITKLPERLTQNGLAILEIDPRQKTKIASFTKKQKLEIKFKEDLNNLIRLAIISTRV